MSERVSKERTRWAVICLYHGRVYLTQEEYAHQMFRENDRWHCPICESRADFDDDNYEEA